MKFKIQTKKLCFLIILSLVSFSILGFINLRYYQGQKEVPKTPHTSGIITHLNELWVTNPGFAAPGDPWYSSKEGDLSDLSVSLSPNQANYAVNGNSGEKEILLNSATYSSWTAFSTTILTPNLGYGGDINGLYCGHDWDETVGPENTPSINWRLNINMGIDMSDYVITSAKFESIIKGTVDPDIDAPYDHVANWDIPWNLTHAEFYDYAQFYVEVSDLGLNEVNTYRIAFNQTRLLGRDIPSNYNIERLIEAESEQAIMNAINNILTIDAGHNNFAVVLGIYIYCEDNVIGFGDDRDQWDELRFKFLNLTLSYEKKINQFTSGSWNQDLDKILGSYVRITDANLSFKFKINQNWPVGSPNSELRIFINDREHDEAIILTDYVYSPSFQEAKPGGFNITSKLLPYENFTLSLQLYLGDNFALGNSVSISITDVYLYISYTEFFPEIPEVITNNLDIIGPLILAAILAIVAIALAIVIRHKPKWRTLKDLSFTTGHPKVVKPDTEYSLSVYPHFPEMQKTINQQIENKESEQDFDSYEPTLEPYLELKCAIELKFRPNVKGIEFFPVTQEIAWYRDIREVNFKLNADSKMVGNVLKGAIDIYKDSVLIGQIPLSIEVSQEERPTEIATVRTNLFDSVFVSYSHEEKIIVDHFREAYKSLGINVKIDEDILQSGDRWSPKLLKSIDESDVFQLYWSEKAKKSQYVTEEWKHALKIIDKKEERFIRPCYWEDPMPSAPDELSDIHFQRVNINIFKSSKEFKKKLKTKTKKR
ncbi:MAG: toll/interleukin-1 receptor domain-containing protein [Candidatus Thorarchaeota archaeon]